MALNHGSLFESAKNEFLQTLEPDEERLFFDTTSAQQILEETIKLDETHSRSSKTRKLATKLQPALACIEQYGKALDILSNIKPEILCVLWGGLRVVLHICQAFVEFFEKITEMLQVIGDNLLRLEIFARLYPRKPQLHQALTAVYTHMFQFFLHARKVFVRGSSSKREKWYNRTTIRVGIKTSWKTFKTQFGDIMERIRYNIDLVEKEAGVAELQEASKERKLAGQFRQNNSAHWDRMHQHQQVIGEFVDDEQRSRVLRYLSQATGDPTSNHTSATSLHEPGTGHWFLQTKEYREWLDGTPASILWLHAIPGAGKTILCSTIIEDVKHHSSAPNSCVVYFYFDYKDVKKQTAVNLLASCIVQLCVQDAGFLMATVSTFKRAAEVGFKEPRLDDILSTLESANTRFTAVTLLIDALDESIERERVCRHLIWLHDRGYRILVTSREESDIKASLSSHDHTFEVPILARHIQGDIGIFIDVELRKRINEHKLKLKDAGLEDTIRDHLAAGAQGMFQWVISQLDYISRLRNDRDIRKALRNIPPDLDQTYIRILEEIKIRQASDIEHTKRILYWLIYSARPLKLLELAELVEVNPEDEYFDPFAIATDPRDTLECCGSLVRIAGEDVVLAHYSIQEYLISNRIQRTTVADFFVNRSEANKYMTETCLRYLNFSNFSEPCKDSVSLSDRLDSFKALGYVASHWPTHLLACQPAGFVDELWDEEYIRFIGLSWFIERGSRYVSWQQVINPVELDMSLVPPMYYAVKFKLLGILNAILSGKEDPNEIGWNGRAPLHEAARQGDEKVIQKLLNNGAAVNIFTTDKRLFTPLHIAAENGAEAAVKTLVKAGADIECRSESQSTPLYRAARSGSRPTVEFLLQSGALVNARTWDNWTPAHEAAGGSARSLLDLLAASGADLGIENAEGFTPVQIQYAVNRPRAIYEDDSGCIGRGQPRQGIIPE